eukprot:scaffold173030_cov18-Tisochrysis_lutea.AAC.1
MPTLTHASTPGQRRAPSRPPCQSARAPSCCPPPSAEGVRVAAQALTQCAFKASKRRVRRMRMVTKQRVMLMVTRMLMRTKGAAQ